MLESLLSIIKKAQERYPTFHRRWEQAEAMTQWDKAVGKLIAKNTRTVQVKNSVLWIEVENPIWKSELHYRKRQILEVLNSKTKEVVKDLFFIDKRFAFTSKKNEKTIHKPKA